MNQGDYHDRFLHQLVVGLAVVLAAFILWQGAKRALRARALRRHQRPVPAQQANPIQPMPPVERASRPPASTGPIEIERREQPTKRGSVRRPPAQLPRP